jgi:hypothetical protein
MAAAAAKSNSPPDVFHASLENFIGMQTRVFRKPYSNAAEREEVIADARATGKEMLRLPATAKPIAKYYIMPEFIVLEVTGTSDWIRHVVAIAKSRYWKSQKVIYIMEDVEIQPYLTRGNYNSTPSPLDPPYLAEHASASYKSSWMNLPPYSHVYIPVGGVTAAAISERIPIESAARKSSTRRRSGSQWAHNLNTAHQRGLTAEAEAKEGENNSVSNAAAAEQGGGKRRKTRKSRK